MGSVREASRRAGVKRGGPLQRAQAARDREKDRLRQQECRRRKREEIASQRMYVGEEIKERLDPKKFGGRVNQRHVRRDANAILGIVSSTLAKTTDVQHQEAVLRAVWSNRITAVALPESRRVSVQVEAQKSIIAGLVQSLSEVKNPRSRADLVTKHAILTAAVSSGASCSNREKARLLGVHPRNVRMALHRRHAMEACAQIVWTLSVRKQRRDVTTESVRAAVYAWWVAETRASPNRKEVVKNWVSPGKSEKHHCQYLLESTASTLNPCP